MILNETAFIFKEVLHMPSNGEPYIGIRDIARLAGVSIATVSRVINHPEFTSPETRARVQAVIDEQHYVPNQTAKSLFTRASNSVALFVYDMSNPFFISLIQELNQVAFRYKHTLLICDTSNDAKKEQEYLDYCTAIRVKGIILTEGFDVVATSEGLRVPLVMFDRSGLKTWSSVQSDNVQSVVRAVNYLYNLNHRRIGCIAPDEGLLSISNRLEGYRQAAEHLKIYHPEYVFSQALSLNVETGVQALNYFLSLPEPPTAIVCANDMIAHGVILRARELNITLPQDLSVIGFDGIDSPLFHDSLTTIRQNIPAIAETLFKLCLHPPDKPQRIIIPTEFIPGSTCSFSRRKPGG